MCPATEMLDPDTVLKWEKWGTMDYTQRNMIAPPAQQTNNPGVPLQYAPEAPRFKKLGLRKMGINRITSKILLLKWLNPLYTNSLTSLQMTSTDRHFME